MNSKTPELTSVSEPFQFNSLPELPSDPPRKFELKFGPKGAMVRIPVEAKVVCPFPAAVADPSKAIQSDFKVMGELPLAILMLVSFAPKESLPAD